jgi:acyl-CoA thioester hydrolase
VSNTADDSEKPDAFGYDLSVRYMEVDAQGVVFNAWYLTYFDEAMTAFLEARGLPHSVLGELGIDFQLVHTAIDWKGSLRWRDNARITVRGSHIGRTSFTLDFATRRQDGEITCTGQTVYVVIAADGSGKREVPAIVRRALGPE